MNKYFVEWFSGIDWGWEFKEMLANNEEQIREFMDKKCPPEFRERHGKDSLKIEFVGTVTIPYIL